MQLIVVYTLFFTALIQLLMAAYAWQRRHEPAALPLTLVFIIGSIWTLAYGVDMTTSDLRTKLLALQVSDTFVSFGPLVFLLLVLEHLGLRHQLRPRVLAALMLIPLALIVLTWSSPYHTLYRYDYHVVRVGELDFLQFSRGPLFLAIMLVLQGLSLVTYYLLIRSLSDVNRFRRQQTITILLAMVVLFLVNAVTILNLSPIPGFDFTPHALALSGGLFAVAIFRFGWLRIAPTARSALVDTLPGGMLAIDLKERIIDVNPAAERILRAPAARLIGREVRTVLSALGTDILPADGAIAVKKDIHVLTPEGTQEYYDLDVIAFSDSGGNVRGHILSFNNISDRKLNELRLMQLRQAVEQSPASVSITDPQGNLIYVNPRFVQTSGYTMDELIGQNPRMMQSGQTPRAVYDEMWRALQSGQPWRGEILNRNKRGELFWELEVIAPVLDSQGRVVNYIAVKEDITDRKKAEEALQLANRELEKRLAEIEALQATLQEQAIRDPLTHLYNRRFLNESIEHKFHQSARLMQPFSIVLIDIDHFKAVNDTYGHLAGDSCLIALADLLGQNSRKSDIVCRYGGEEFLLVLPDADSAAAAKHAEKIRRQFNEMPFTLKAKQVTTTLSLGVASYPEHGHSYEEIIEKADKALYHSKQNGRNRVTIWPG